MVHRSTDEVVDQNQRHHFSLQKRHPKTSSTPFAISLPFLTHREKGSAPPLAPSLPRHRRSLSLMLYCLRRGLAVLRFSSPPPPPPLRPFSLYASSPPPDP
uniref:Uncharacterized protein n=1 Tax=Ananas comosus var. bracteatus TaxID=296719 RepID=A0A6V7QAX9_ANACO|nr:unnamed protein product [Ananas comosus var. bracteatus]